MIINVIVYTLPWRTRTLVATNEPPLLARKKSGVISTYNRVTIIYIYILLPFRAHFFFFFFNSRRITERRWSIDRSETQAKNRANPLLQLPRFPSNIYIYIFPILHVPKMSNGYFARPIKKRFSFSLASISYTCIHSSESVFETRKTLSVEKSEGRIGLRYTSICYAWQSRRLEHRIDTCSSMQLKLAT